MTLSLNNIIYGNPTQRHLEIISEKCLVDDLYVELKNFPFPNNESDTTKQELNEIVENIEDMKSTDNEKYKNRYIFYDRNLFQAINNSFQTDKINVKELIDSIDLDTSALILRLKYFYQRPRPYQLANYFKLKLFPFASKSALSPSYPSGHTVQAYVILNVLGSKVPEFYNKAKEMIDDVAYSRNYLGVHYTTDNDFAYQVAQEILKNNDFAKKYGI
jgi:hypothetical protein